MNDKVKEDLGEKIVSVIKTIFDPEIPVDIYELGLIYDVFVNEDMDVKVLMTLTSPNCPVAETLPMEVLRELERITIDVLDQEAAKKEEGQHIKENMPYIGMQKEAGYQCPGT